MKRIARYIASAVTPRMIKPITTPVSSRWTREPHHSRQFYPTCVLVLLYAAVSLVGNESVEVPEFESNACKPPYRRVPSRTYADSIIASASTQSR